MEIAHPLAGPLCEKWGPLIEKYIAIPNLEIEIRFGRRSMNRFDTNVRSRSFYKVMNSLNNYEWWESKKHTSSAMYYYKGSQRLTIDHETGEHIRIIKKRVIVDDFLLYAAPFDVRLDICTEQPFEYGDGDDVITRQATRERWSFIRKNLSIDLTIVKAPNEETVYQIEMEIIDPKLLSGKGESFKLISKIFDLLKCL